MTHDLKVSELQTLIIKPFGSNKVNGCLGVADFNQESFGVDLDAILT